MQCRVWAAWNSVTLEQLGALLTLNRFVSSPGFKSWSRFCRTPWPCKRNGELSVCIQWLLCLHSVIYYHELVIAGYLVAWWCRTWCIDHPSSVGSEQRPLNVPLETDSLIFWHSRPFLFVFSVKLWIIVKMILITSFQTFSTTFTVRMCFL